MATMKLVIVDLYGDGEDLSVFEDKAGLDEAIAAFGKADDDYAKSGGSGEYHGGFSDFMSRMGHSPLDHREVALWP